MPDGLTLQDAIVQRLRASAAVTALIPAGNVWAGELPVEDRLPFLHVEAEVDDYEAIIPGSRLETVRVKLTARAQASPPPGTGQPRSANPAEAIIEAAMRALDWQDLDVPTYLPIHFWEDGRVRSKAERKLGPDGERVWRAIGRYELQVGREYR